MNCENCEIEHEGNYGSGRFCSSGCARGYSTKEKRSLINDKVSSKLKKEKPLIKLICESCKTEFNFFRIKQTCSKECQDELQRGKLKTGNYSKNGGIREGGGRSKSLEYVNHLGEHMKLNKDEILVAEILDKLKMNWNRNWKYFKYEDLESNEIRKFYPDFYVSDFDLYVEYKGWLTDSMRHKMKDAKIKNSFNLLIVVGEDRRFANDGLNINELEKYIRSSLRKQQVSKTSHRQSSIL